MKTTLRARNVSCPRASRQAIVFAIIFLSLFCCELPEAYSSVVSTTGSVFQIAPPASAALDALESNTVAELFTERSSVLLVNNITADVMQPGAVDSQITLSPGQISAGQRVDSYLIHVDPIGSLGSLPFTYQGSVTFDTPILGLVWSTVNLNASDAALGAPATLYGPINSFRGYEGPGLASPMDSLVLSPDRLTLSLALRTTQYYDQIRIVTASVPEPATIALLAMLTLVFPPRYRVN